MRAKWSRWLAIGSIVSVMAGIGATATAATPGSDTYITTKTGGARVDVTFLEAHGVTSAQITALDYFAPGVEQLLRSGSMTDAQAQNLIKGLIPAVGAKPTPGHSGPVSPFPSFNHPNAAPSGQPTSPLTCSSGGAHYYVESTYGMQEATGYAGLPSVSVTYNGTTQNDVPYMMYGDYPYGSPGGSGADIGLFYSKPYGGSGGWYTFYDVYLSGTYQWGQGSVNIASDTSDPYEWLTVLNNQLQLEVINPSSWTVLDTITTPVDSTIGWQSNGTNQEINREDAMAQVCQNLSDGATFTNGNWSTLYLYYPIGNSQWTSTYTRTAGSNYGSPIVSVTNQSPYYYDDVTITY